VPSKSHKVNFKPREYITSLHLLSHFILSPRTHCNRESRPSRIPITTILMVCQRVLDMMVSPSSPRCSLDFSFVVFSATMQSWFLIRIVELFWPMRSSCYLSSWRIVARCQHTLAEPLAPFPLMLCLTASAVACNTSFGGTSSCNLDSHGELGIRCQTQVGRFCWQWDPFLRYIISFLGSLIRLFHFQMNYSILFSLDLFLCALDSKCTLS